MEKQGTIYGSKYKESEVRKMITDERKERIRKNAEKLVQMDKIQLLMVKTFQDGIEMGQQIEREKLNKVLADNSKELQEA